MATYQWSIPTGNTINGLTYIKDTDNKIQATMDDLVEFVNGEGAYAGQGLAYDFVKSDTTAQSIGGVKTFTGTIVASNTITGSISGNAATADKLTTARTLSLAGDVTGSITFDGSADKTISVSATSTLISTLLGSVYPVGSVYINASSTTNPSTLLGFGTWVEIGQGRVLVGQDTGDSSFNSMGETGGSKNAIAVAHTHSFSATTSSDSHYHYMFNTNAAAPGKVTSSEYAQADRSDGGNSDYIIQGSSTVATLGKTSTDTHSHSVSGTTGSTGSSGTNANLQPYLVVKMWKRTA